MIVVKAQPGDTSDSLIRKFSKKVATSRLLKEYRKREFYQKPSEIKKEKANQIKRRKYSRKAH